MSTAEASSVALPRNFLRACVLLLLREEPAHGYDLIQQLRPFGFTREDPGRLYRTLRALEDDGFVHSAWEPSDSGPDRRIYRLSRAGLRELKASAGSIAEVRRTLDSFLGRFEEFVALRPDAKAARPTTSVDRACRSR